MPKYFKDKIAQERECGKCKLIRPYSDFPKNPYGEPTATCYECRRALFKGKYVPKKYPARRRKII